MMYFTGRPELELPPAPDTQRLRVLRALSFLVWLATTLLVAWQLAEVYVYGPSSSLLLCMGLLTIAMSLIIAQGLRAAYFLHLLAYEEAWWTHERVRQHCPSVWYLYCAGNALASSYYGEARG